MVTGRTMLLVNVDLYCTQEGQGPPLLVHHGGPGLDQSVIAPHLQPLREHFQLICFDHRGTGRSAMPKGSAPYSIERFVDDVAELAAALELGPFALLGHSFGGIVALNVALAHPDMLSHLILVCTPTSHHYVRDVEAILPEALDREALVELSSLQHREPSEAVIRRSLKLLAPVYFRNPDRVAELGLDDVRFGPESQAVWDSLDGFDLRPLLSEIDVPTLVIAGAEDRSVTPARAQETAEALPQGKLLVIEESGHYPFIENPEPFLRGINEFLGMKVKKKGIFGRR